MCPTFSREDGSNGATTYAKHCSYRSVRKIPDCSESPNLEYLLIRKLRHRVSIPGIIHNVSILRERVLNICLLVPKEQMPLSIYASGIIAAVEYPKIIGRFAMHKLPRNSVRPHRMLVKLPCPIDSIPVGIKAPVENPAGSQLGAMLRNWSILAHLIPKTRLTAISLSRLTLSVSATARRVCLAVKTAMGDFKLCSTLAQSEEVSGLDSVRSYSIRGIINNFISSKRPSDVGDSFRHNDNGVVFRVGGWWEPTFDSLI